MDVLEELWSGNVVPNEPFIKKGTEYATAVRQVAKEEEKLFSMLSSDRRELVERVLDAQMSVAMIAERDAFVRGFQLGVRVMVECLDGS